MIKSKIDLSLEDKLLKFCAQIDAGDRIKKRLKEILGGNLNWPHILQESAREGIIYLLYNNLLQFKDRVPQNIWNSLKDAYYITVSRNVRIYQKMNTLLSSFDKENTEVIPLKGIFLAEKIYNNIALRGMSDVDLLIKKEELPKINKLLENLGYRTAIRKELLFTAIEKSYMNSIDYFKTGEDATLHIHWHIVNVSLPTYFYTENIDMDKFWKGSRPVEIADVETLQLAPHHLIIYLAEHALKHSFDRLILLSDINAVLERYKDEIDWDGMIKEAKELGMERQLFYGLCFTNHFLDTDIPNQVLSRLRPKKLDLLEQRFFHSVKNNKRNTKWCYFVYLNMVKGITNKLRFVFRTFFPPPSVLALFFNLDKPKITIKDYFMFLRKRFFHLKKSLTKN